MSASNYTPNQTLSLSAAADFSAVFWTKNITLACIQVVFSSSGADGSMWLEVSADSNDKTPTNWTRVTQPDSTMTVAGNSEPYLWEVSGISGTWIRVVYDRTSGSGTADVTFNGKGAL